MPRHVSAALRRAPLHLIAAAVAVATGLGCTARPEGTADETPATAPQPDPVVARIDAMLAARRTEARVKLQNPPLVQPERQHAHIQPHSSGATTTTSGARHPPARAQGGLSVPLGDINAVLPVEDLAAINTGAVPQSYASVMDFGAHADNVDDDAPAFQAALAALSGTGVALYIPPGTYLVTEQIDLSPSQVIVGAPGTVIHQNLTARPSYSAFSGVPTVGSPAILLTATVLGENQISTELNAAEGSWILLQDAAGLRGNLYQVSSSLPVADGYQLTLDRPVNWAFSTSDLVYPVTTMMQDVYIFGEGMVISGPAAAPYPSESGYIGFGAAYHCFVYDVQVDGRYGMFNTDFGTGINFDIGSHDCAAYRTTVDCYDQTRGVNVALAAFAAQSTEGIIFQSDAAVNCNQGFWIGSGYGNTVADGTATASHDAGLKLTTTELAVAGGSSNNTVVGTTFSQNAQGVLIDEGSSFNVFTSCTVQNSVTNGVNLQPNGGGTVGNRFADLTVEGSGLSGAAAVVISGNNHELEITNLTTQRNQAAGVYVNGRASVVNVDGWTSVDDGLSGASLTGQGVVAGSATLNVSNAQLSSSVPIPGMASYFEVYTSGSTLVLDNVSMTQLDGAGASNQIAIDNSDAAGAVIRLTNVTASGTLLGGVWAAGAPSLTYVLEGVDLSSATYPFYVAQGALANFGTFTANGVQQVVVNGAFSQSATFTMSLVASGTNPCAGLPTFTAPTVANSFFVASSTPGCNSAYSWRAQE